MEDGLGLTTITALLAVITTLSLGEQRSLSGLVLGDLVLGVYRQSVTDGPTLGVKGKRTLLAVLALAVGAASLRYVDLELSQPPWQKKRIILSPNNPPAQCKASSNMNERSVGGVKSYRWVALRMFEMGL